ncbi:MAG: amidoligase family protein, partial [Rhodospirillaceae bacterium]
AEAAQAKSEEDDIAHRIIDGARQVLGQVSEIAAPYEITSPPLDLGNLSQMDRLVRALSDAGATDTLENWVYGFGVQLNPEVVSLEASSILRYLQSYMLLNDWLRSEIAVDVTRRVLPFADPFPAAYRARILAADYSPSLTELIDDYLADNPTRNRDLDMLPLFTYLDEDRVAAAIDDGLTKSRPTFHYRLPDCRLNDPKWSVTAEWNRWAYVERLAEDRERLRSMADAWMKREWDGSFASWVESVREWIS